MTTTQAARFLGVSESEIERLISVGELNRAPWGDIRGVPVLAKRLRDGRAGAITNPACPLRRECLRESPPGVRLLACNNCEWKDSVSPISQLEALRLVIVGLRLADDDVQVARQRLSALFPRHEPGEHRGHA